MLPFDYDLQIQLKHCIQLIDTGRGVVYNAPARTVCDYD